MAIILLVYYIISLLFFILVIWKMEERFIIGGLLFLIPILGIIIAYYLFFVKTTPRKHASDEDTMTIAPTLSRLNLDVEMNRVPIVDALSLNDNRTKRATLIESLKDNAIQNVEVLSLALKNEDTETSHYAATAILEMKRKLASSLQELSVKVEADPTNLALLESYAEVLKKQANNTFLDPVSIRRYKYTYSNVLERILTFKKEEPQYYVEKINCDLSLKEYQKAYSYCQRFLKEHPSLEDSYLLLLSYHYQMKDSMAFQEALTLLKKSPVRLSSQGLSMLRYWQ